MTGKILAEKNISVYFGYLNYSRTFAVALTIKSLPGGQIQDTNKHKPPERFPGTSATHRRSARSPATAQHKIISNEHKGKKQKRTKRGIYVF